MKFLWDYCWFHRSFLVICGLLTRRALMHHHLWSLVTGVGGKALHFTSVCVFYLKQEVPRVRQVPSQWAPPGGAGWSHSKSKPVQFSPGWPLASTVTVCRMLVDSCHLYVACIRLRRLAAWNPPQDGVLWSGGRHTSKRFQALFFLSLHVMNVTSEGSQRHSFLMAV